MAIHPTAIIETGADVHPTAQIGAYSIIESGAVIGADCMIESCVRIYGMVRLGSDNRIGHGSVIGSEPQALGFQSDQSKPVVIGNGNQFKEGVTISRGMKNPAGTRIGDRNYLMAQAHIGHDCQVGDDNIFANAATLGGHVELAHHTFLSSQVAVHQFCRIGAYCMIGGVSGVTQDVPPFVLANGQRARIIGLNTVGLRRNGFNAAQRQQIKAVYRLFTRPGLLLTDALTQAENDYPSAVTMEIVHFVRSSLGKRGIIAFHRRSESTVTPLDSRHSND
ncbi:acyl-ACP--UDP-N-acetylglucosamine O-acyltransferase [Thiospirillum jenense]|uniref:Acyl-ACP--UDP-N-acetylglucosamine O-acyltransferase n=1 Tax=Thiospirillum jenense TaxID=1653858 RepID=A0A839HEM1_9GAMM|nr:acyl-ACP--UDP-N-acetylglucosamine O-acyltransferase [Thiospirillum jenense]MBB1127303.1 acyl-ACP--UDP-N-acetylglucosamine O-acyltransferase [Thiospirillum jenense]